MCVLVPPAGGLRTRPYISVKMHRLRIWQKNKKTMTRIILLILTILLLAHCSRGGDQCIYAGDFDGLKQRSAKLYAFQDQVVDANIDIPSGARVIITVEGSMELCYQGGWEQHDEVTVHKITPDPQLGHWQGCYVHSGTGDDPGLF